jgi:hypothetical protein
VSCQSEYSKRTHSSIPRRVELRGVAVLTYDVQYLEDGRKDEISDDKLYDQYVACTTDRLAMNGPNEHSQA